MKNGKKSKNIAENKLLILYVLDRAKAAVGSIRLAKYVLEQRLMDYLSFQQHIHELVESGHARREFRAVGGGATVSDSDGESGAAGGSDAAGGEPVGSGDHTFYLLTDSGARMLAELSGLLPATEKHRVDRTCGAFRKNNKNELAVAADYRPESEHSTRAILALSEGELSLIRIEFLTGSRADARAACENWKGRTAELYTKIAELLTSRPVPDDKADDIE
ncbi:MAG: DUF4364 family protein [Clostridiales bacterium]|jgi:hypothetical protein|nr:DUF4364 family protein [Clostridiales bacterium]